jgi:hypothetical protein
MAGSSTSARLLAPLPQRATASSHSAAAPGTVTVSGENSGSSVPDTPAARIASSVRPAGAAPLPARQRTRRALAS